MKEEDIALINLYLEGNLSDDEIDIVEQRMEKDPVFQARVEIIRDTEVAQKLGTPEFRNIVEEVGQSYKKSSHGQKKTISIGYRKWVMAASILALLVSGFLLLYVFSSPADSEQLYAEYFTPYPNNMTVRNDVENDLLSTAMGLYDAEKYQEAIAAFERIEKNERSETVVFYEGLSYLSDSQPKKAILKLSLVADNDQSNYQIQAKWYMALAHIKDRASDKAKQLLNDISMNTKSEVYAKKAKLLLKKLK